MELECQTGSKIKLKNQTKLGRKSLFQTPDKTISRHHITLNPNSQKRILNFVVYGKNPIFVVHEKDGIKVYRRGDNGEMKMGDAFYVGSKDFFWFKLREIGDDGKKMEELGVDFDEIGSVGGESESLDVSESDVIDPVKGISKKLVIHLAYRVLMVILRFIKKGRRKGEMKDGGDVKKMEELGVGFNDIGSAGGEIESFGGDDVVSDVVDPVKDGLESDMLLLLRTWAGCWVELFMVVVTVKKGVAGGDNKCWLLELSTVRFNAAKGALLKCLIEDEDFIKRSRSTLREEVTLNEIHEQELEDHVMARMEEQFDQFVDQLSDQMDQLMNRCGNYNVRGTDDKQSENPFGEDDDSSSDEQSGR
ncbi:forkhead-associated domain-containing protein [Tanacetum coccineum]